MRASWKNRWRNHGLQGNLAGEHRVVTAVDDAHRSAADAVPDLITAQGGDLQRKGPRLWRGSRSL
jgi:hypothetical protein